MKLQLKVSIFALFSTILSLPSPKQASKMSAFNKYHGLKVSKSDDGRTIHYDSDQVWLALSLRASRSRVPINSSTPLNVYTNLDTSSDGLTSHHSRTLHMVHLNFSRAILVATP